MFSASLVGLILILVLPCNSLSLELKELSGRDNQLKGDEIENFTRHLYAGNLHISFSARQEKGTSGTLLHASIGRELLFSIHSAQDPDIVGDSGLLVMRYKGANGVRIAKIPFDLTDGEHNFVFSIVNGRIGLSSDCNILVDGRNNPLGLPLRNRAKSRFFIGQKNRHQSYFLGYIQHFRISERPLDTKCVHHRPTRRIKPARDHGPGECHNCDDVNYLRHRINQMDDRLKLLENQSETHHHRLSRIQRNQRGCFQKGRFHADSEQWDNGKCTTCTCVEGYPVCHPAGCPKVNCLKPVKKPGSCCPECMESCTYNGKSYQHGEVAYLKKCYEIHCNNSQVSVRVIKHNCPALPCPSHMKSNQKSASDCCPRCKKGFDYCGSGHKCGRNAECSNDDDGAVCTCNAGYVGDADTECVDFDECSIDQDIAGPIGCGQGAVCVNTPGSFECHCRPGFLKVKGQCFDLLRYK